MRQPVEPLATAQIDPGGGADPAGAEVPCEGVDLGSPVSLTRADILWNIRYVALACAQRSMVPGKRRYTAHQVIEALQATRAWATSRLVACSVTHRLL